MKEVNLRGVYPYWNYRRCLSADKHEVYPYENCYRLTRYKRYKRYERLWLFILQRLNGIVVGGTAGGDEAEDDADSGADS